MRRAAQPLASSHEQAAHLHPAPRHDALPLRTSRGVFAAREARPRRAEPRGTALLLPGYTGSKEDFIAMLAPLAEAGYRVVAVDGARAVRIRRDGQRTGLRAE